MKKLLSFIVITVLVLIISCAKNDSDVTPQSKLKATTTTTIVVRTHGISGAEHITATVGGTQVGAWTVTTSYADYTCTTTGTGSFNVNFDNDASGRDVQVDYIQVNGSTRQAEAQVTNTAVYQNSKCGGTLSEMMHCNGYIGFGVVGGSTGGGGTTASFEVGTWSG